MCLWGAMFAAIAALPLSASEATSSPVVINAFMTRSEILSLLILVKHLSVALKGPGGSSGPGYKLDILRINPVNEIICGRAALPHPSELEIGPENQACEKVFSETYGITGRWKLAAIFSTPVAERSVAAMKDFAGKF